MEDDKAKKRMFYCMLLDFISNKTIILIITCTYVHIYVMIDMYIYIYTYTIVQHDDRANNVMT